MRAAGRAAPYSAGLGLGERVMSGTPTVAGKAPIKVDVEASKTYWWCACGQSKTQPFCDGSHKGTAFSPLKYDATEATAVWFCACKQTANKPLCDGSHKHA